MLARSILACLALICPLAASARSVAITVERGRRMVDWCRALEAEGIASEEDVARIAATEPLADYPFLPPARIFAAGTAAERIRRFEGMFVPGVYRLETPAPGEGYQAALSIIRQLLDRTRERLANARIDNGLGAYSSAILASIVEKEAVLSRQHGLVASTLVNRMRQGMGLSCCSTVEYALGYHRPFLTAEDIAVESPYNTYRQRGLPPTPICFFSEEAWEAVERPPTSRYLFLVFDWAAGEVRFAVDYQGHVRNVALARADFMAAYGDELLHRKYPDKFYEPVSAP